MTDHLSEHVSALGAASFEAARAEALAQSCREFTKRALHSVPPLRIGARFADLGAGAGAVCEMIAASYPDGEIVAVDRAFDRGQQELHGWSLVRADLTAMPFGPNGMFDMVILRNVLMEIPERKVVRKAAIDLVIPGGYIMLADLVPAQIRDPDFRRAFAAYRYLAEHEDGIDLATGYDHADVLEEAGFQITHLAIDTLPVRPGHLARDYLLLTLQGAQNRLIAGGYVDLATLHATYELLLNPRHLDSALSLVTVVARRPEEDE